MTEEKMIEELAKTMGKCNHIFSCEICIQTRKEIFETNEKLNGCDLYNRAKILYKANWRKIPENAVVIPEKITEETSPEDIIKIAKYNETIRKETAREIIEKARYLIEERNGMYGFDLEDVSVDGVIVVEVLDELAKEHGVEVEE